MADPWTYRGTQLSIPAVIAQLNKEGKATGLPILNANEKKLVQYYIEKGPAVYREALWKKKLVDEAGVLGARMSALILQLRSVTTDHDHSVGE